MESDGSYEFFDHAADVGIRIQAPSRAALFATSARALMAWIGPAPEGAATVHQDLEVEGEDPEELLVRWLQEVLYQFHHRRAYLMEVPKIDLTDRRVRATCVAALWKESSYQNFQEVKAITYHQLRVWQEGATWKANVILDL